MKKERLRDNFLAHFTPYYESAAVFPMICYMCSMSLPCFSKLGPSWLGGWLRGADAPLSSALLLLPCRTQTNGSAGTVAAIIGTGGQRADAAASASQRLLQIGEHNTAERMVR